MCLHFSPGACKDRASKLCKDSKITLLEIDVLYLIALGKLLSNLQIIQTSSNLFNKSWNRHVFSFLIFIDEKYSIKLIQIISFPSRCALLCWAGNNEHIIWCWVGLFHGCVWSCPSISLLMGQHFGVEALTNGHHLSLFRQICCRGVCVGMWPTKHSC